MAAAGNAGRWRGGSGGGGATWSGRGKPARGRGGGGRGSGGHVARLRAARGQGGLGKTADEGGGVLTGAKQRKPGLEVEDEDPVAIFQKCRDSTVKPR